jgi:ubiquinone/menaquinone biosynthesis C-methylase UbiE
MKYMETNQLITFFNYIMNFHPKKKQIYDGIGKEYNFTRTADPRILTMILKLLSCGKHSIIADIGAGTGNYSFQLAKRGYIVHALEPSELMHHQKKEHPNLKWLYGLAESIPLKTNSAHGIISTLAIHHFNSVELAFKEMYRILKMKGRLVIFTADPAKVQKDSWLKEYFYPLFIQSRKHYPNTKLVLKLLERKFKTTVQVTPFLLPDNLKDGFFYSAWKYPEKYLDRGFRRGISVFAKSSQKTVSPLLKQLAADLKCGVWDQKYAHVRNLGQYDGGYMFISVKKT